VAVHVRKTKDFGGTDKRYFHRWEVENRVLYRLDNETKFHEGLTNDLSCAGACISVDQSFQTNQKVQLKIYFNDDINVDLEGNVIWNKQRGKRNQIGVFFSTISNKAQDLILKHAYTWPAKKDK